MESLAGLPALGRSTRPSHPLLRAVALGGCCKLAQHGGASAAASLAANQRSCDHQSAARPALPFSAPPLPDFSPGAGHLQLSPGIRPKPSQTSTPRSRVSSRKQPQDTAHAARVTAPGEPRDLAQVLMHPSASGRRGGITLHAADVHLARPDFLAPALSGPPDSFSPRLIARLISLTTSRAHRLVTLPLVECAASLRPLRSCSRARSSPPRRRA